MTTLGISTWSIRRLLGPTYPGLDPDAPERPADTSFGPGALNLLDLPTALQAHGYATLDLCHFHLPRTDDAYLAALRARLAEAGITLLTFLVDDGDISAADPVTRARDVAATQAWIERAARLGARYVRVAAGASEAKPDDPAIGYSAASLLALARHARAQGVDLLTETWQPLALPPENVRAILAATRGEVGLCADFNNYQHYPADAKYAALRAVLPGASTIHAGGQLTAAGQLDEADFRHCLTLAQEAAFTGPYVLIFSGPGDEWAGLAQLAGLVREVTHEHAMPALQP